MKKIVFYFLGLVSIFFLTIQYVIDTIDYSILRFSQDTLSFFTIFMIICALASIALLVVIGIYAIKACKNNYKFGTEELVLLLVAICVNLTFITIFKTYILKLNLDNYNQILIGNTNTYILNTIKINKLNTIVNYILFIVEGIVTLFCSIEALISNKNN